LTKSAPSGIILGLARRIEISPVIYITQGGRNMTDHEILVELLKHGSAGVFILPPKFLYTEARDGED
jgi:hypothetical protein